MAYPNSTGPSLTTKATTYDVSTNTAQHFNGADWNDMRTLLHAMRGQLVGTYRGYTERRSPTTLTAVRVHTFQVVSDGYRKTGVTGRLLIPGVTGTVYVYARGNTGSAAVQILTAAAEPAPYATTTRDFPLARVDISGGAMAITSLRPDWVLPSRP